ncbi:hypothetical protein [Bradyrhizobium quebecense]|uniref:Uncharacterized protein n=2 Tax=Bradyrhizobium quebecense TaxID=2748629 RepID=A0ACD3V7V9_9BRAD|nr:hypothetical protein [Bradyrhizobium quebecense]UGY02526.1 hypothetical protein J4P68_0036505 [Bradyrhizobium quebecense]
MADQDSHEIVWGEVSGLSAKDGNDQTLTRLEAVVAKLAVATKGKGLDKSFRRKLAPRASEKRALAAYNALTMTVDQVEAGTFGPPDVPLPNRAVLWEINESGMPPRDHPPPKAASWIFETGATHGGDFVAGSGQDARTYRLFESTTASTGDDLPYISSYTSFGVPSPAKARHWYQSPNWWIGLFGAAVFFLALFNVLWTATSFSQAFDLMTNRQQGYVGKFTAGDGRPPLPNCPDNASNDVKPFCLTPEEAKYDGVGVLIDRKTDKAKDDAANLRNDKLDTFATVIGPQCVKLLTDRARNEVAVRKSQTILDPLQGDARTKSLICLTILGAALEFSSNYLVIQVQDNNWFSKYVGSALRYIIAFALSWHVPSNAAENVSLGMPTALMIFGVILVLVGLGRGIMGTPLGVLISPQNRYSLALAQVTCWTVLVLTSVVAIAVFNAGLVSEQMRYFLPASNDVAPTAIKNGFFPDIPTGIWAVLGITLSTTVLSTWIKSLKGTLPEADFSVAGATRGAERNVFFTTPTETRSDEHSASVADWFLSEDAGKTDRIDISRVQMVLVTAGLLATYGHAIFASFRNLPTPEILLAIQSLTVLIPGLPIVGATMAIMLSVSHATYLVAKAADKP